MKSEIYKLSQLRKMNQLDGDKELIFVHQVNKRVELLKEDLFKTSFIEHLTEKQEEELLNSIDNVFGGEK